MTTTSAPSTNRRVVTDVYCYSHGLEHRCGSRSLEIRTRHDEAAFQQHLGNGRHPRSPDADEVNPVRARRSFGGFPDELGKGRGRSRTTDAESLFSHVLQTPVILEQFAGDLGDPLSGRVLVRQDDGGSRSLQHPAVTLLLTVAVVRIRHDDGRQTDDTELGHGGRSPPAKSQVGDRVGEDHGVHVSLDAIRCQRCLVRPSSLPARVLFDKGLGLQASRDVKDLNVIALRPFRRQSQRRLVDPLSALAPPEDEQCLSLGV